MRLHCSLVWLCLALCADPAGGVTVRVFYVRHGQSQWNAEQQRQRRLQQLSEAELLRLGHTHAFTDSPLSAQGAREALHLAKRLFADADADADAYADADTDADATADAEADDGAADARGADAGGIDPPPPSGFASLSAVMRRAVRRPSSAPALLTSNLRRAIDTALLAYRPLLQRTDAPLLAVPALQETATHADCIPLGRTKSGDILIDPADADAADGIADAADVAADADADAEADAVHDGDVRAEVLRLQADAVGEAAGGAAAGAALLEYVVSAYKTRLRIAEHTVFDDRRRFPPGTIGGSDQPPLRPAAALGPFLRRLAELLALALGSAPRPVLITAHSRLLREILFAFWARMRLDHLSGIEDVSLAFGHNVSAACEALREEGTKLSNTGAVAFDLSLCVPPACAAPTLWLRNCRLDAGGRVLPRLAPPSPSAGSTSRPSAGAGASGLTERLRWLESGTGLTLPLAAAAGVAVALVLCVCGRRQLLRPSPPTQGAHMAKAE